MATVLLLLDAMRPDYLDEQDTPFLCACARQGEHYQQVIPGHGFCERTEILAGLSPAESGFFTAIGFNPAESPYRRVPGLPLLAAGEALLRPVARVLLGPQSGRAMRYFRRQCNRLFALKGVRLQSYAVPFTFLRYFALTEDARDHRRPGAFPRASVLDLLRREQRGFLYDAFTALGMPTRGGDAERLQTALEHAADETIDFYPVYVSVLDTCGHRYGPASRELRAAMKHLDAQLAAFVDAFETRRPGTQFIFLGDHGMVPVEQCFDAQQELLAIARRLKLRRGKDYLYFLDSTCVRVWALADRVSEPLLQAMKASSRFTGHGAFVTDDDPRFAFLSRTGRLYGDLLWLANPGVLVFPDFFHRDTPCRGMHGYAPRSPGSQGTCIVWGRDMAPSTQPELPLTGVFDLLKKGLHLDRSE